MFVIVELLTEHREGGKEKENDRASKYCKT
jgi:hypothetical protein